MSKTSFQILGHVIDQKTRDGVEGLRVETWDKDLLVDDLVGSAMTDDHGAFRLEIARAYFSELFLDRRPDLYFKVFQDKTLLKSTEDSLLWNVNQGETEITIEVDLSGSVPTEQANAPRECVVKGQVSRTDGTLLAGTIVQAFDLYLLKEQLLGEGITDATGKFKISYGGEQFKQRGGPDLIMRVVDKQGGVLVTSEIILHAQPAQEVDLVIKSPKPVDERPLIVRGTVRDANSTPVDGVMVRAFDRDLRSEELLGEAPTDAKGSYEIPYAPEQFRRAEKGNADLLVRAYDLDRTELAASPIHFNANSIEVIDLTIGTDKLRQRSEYERYIAELASILEDVPLPGLTLEDIAFLAGETRIDQQHIDYLVSSQKWSVETGVQPAALYGLQRVGLPTTLPELLAESEQRQRAALEAAISSNIIPLSIRNEIDSILAKLHDSFVKRIIRQPGPNGEARISRALAGALPSVELQEAFVSASIAHSQNADTSESFWERMRSDVRFGSGDIDRIQFSVQLAALTSNHSPLIEALQKKHQDGEISSLRDLARLDPADWANLIQQTASDLPANVPGKDTGEKIRNFTATIASSVELQFPSAVIASRLSRDTGFDMPHKTAVATFLDEHTDFEFGTTNITNYLADHEETAFKGVDDRRSFTDQLEKMQRVAHVAPRYDQMRALISKGLDSSLAISRFSPERFASDHARDLGGAAVAYAIHDAAVQKTATTNTLVTDIRSLVAGTSLAVLPIKDQAKKIADLRTLFGALDFCDCSECRSVLSPAAYLVDVLEFLKHRNSESDPSGRNNPRSVRDIFWRRRPDIGEIELTCENTNTPVPYLDLVNEVLENAVFPIVEPDEWHHLPLPLNKHEQFQTRLSAEELSAYPEHVNSGAYERLRLASFPWTLPFDLSMEETRAYLSHLGASRADLIATFRQPARPTAADDRTSIAIARDTLGLTTKAWEVIVDTSLSHVTEDWGDGLGWPNADFGDVRSFLDRSGLSYTELNDLLDTRYINPDPANRTVRIEPSDSCDIGEMRLTGITDLGGGPIVSVPGRAILSRTHRFIRLWRTLGWTMGELDTAIRALGAPDIDQMFLLRLSDLLRVQSRLPISREQSLSLYGNLETHGQNAFYNTVFRNPHVLSQFSDPAFMPETLINPGSISIPLEGHTATIRAALVITEQELAKLLDLLGRSLPVTGELKLTLENLSFFYRHTLLSRALRLTAAELAAVLRLTGIDPFNRGDINGTLRFVDAVEAIRGSGVSINELSYLFEGHATEPFAFEPTTDSIAGALESILESLAALEPSASQALRTHLVIQGLSQSLGVSPEIVTPLLTRYLCADGVVDRNPDGTAVHPAIEDFLDPGFVGSVRPFTVIDTAPTTKSYRFLHKTTLLLSKFGIGEPELRWLFNPVDQTDRGLDLNLLTRVGTAGYRAAEGFRMWSRLVDLVRLRNRSGTEKLEGIMAKASLPSPGGTGAVSTSLLEAISRFGPWRLDDVQSIVGHLGLTQLALGGEGALTRLTACCDMARSLGVTGDRCWSWTNPALTPVEARAVAEEIREAVKARFTNEQWLAIAKPLRDKLRVRQTAALVAYLLAHPPAALLTVEPPIGLPWRTPGDLYAYFLIDVEMGSCAMTSRIKLAHSSIQLFVQRCLLDIEPEVRADAKQDSAWLQWENWMKNYRVWEANRKIFLYPENWVEPELRDDKTTLFKDLESELLQNDPTTETTEAAFTNYFEKLDTIARPEIAAMYREPGHPSVLHVFGRTRGTSHVYYYRRQITTTYGSSWTAWEKINVDIEGDHLIPVVWNSRLYLFWPTFIEQTERQQAKMPDQGEVIPDPKKYRKMQLAWSQYRHNKWTAKMLSRESARIPSDGSVEIYFLATPTDGGDLVIRCIARIGRAFEFLTRMTPPVTKLIDFRFAGSDGTVKRMPLQDGSFIALLPGTHLEGMTFVEDGNQGFLILGQDGEVFQRSLRNLYDSIFHIQIDGALVPFRVSTEAADAGDAWKPLESEAGALGANAVTAASLSIAASQPLVNVPFSAVRNSDRLELSMLSRMRTVLERLPVSADAPNLFRVLIPYYHRTSVDEFFFQDDTRTFFVALAPDQAMRQEVLTQLEGLDPQSPEYCQLLFVLGIGVGATLQYEFHAHYHPFVRVLMQKLNQEGIDGLMQREVQLHPHLIGTSSRAYNFVAMYGPSPASVRLPGPIEEIDFSTEGAYSQYNWELFFHAPLLIAGKLSANQRFAEAQKWYHYIFDPTDKSSEEPPQRYWRMRHFFNTTSEKYQQQRIDNLLRGLSGTHDPKLDNQVQQWRENPFNPHLVARLRTTAFQKTVVMNYLDNLIAWGDQLFRQDTLESINEATQLYMLAAEILGPRPEPIRPRTQPQTHTYNSLANLLDSFSNALVSAENATPPPSVRSTPAAPGQKVAANGAALTRDLATKSDLAKSGSEAQPVDDRMNAPARTMMPPLPPALYFCVPPNDKLLGYWDRVADRLFKVRHCMNIEGVQRQLPLFEPPIDASLLVRARAAGIDMRLLMSEIGAGAPLNYRFAVLAQKAGELCGDVRGFGGGLLSAFQARDAEAFARLRSGHELAVLGQMQQIKEYQIEEATRALEGLRKSLETTTLRRNHYASLTLMNPGEQNQIDSAMQSLTYQRIATELELLGAILHAVPDFKIAFLTSTGGTFGGDNLGHALQGMSRYIGAQGSILGAQGGISAILGGYQRRKEEWDLQVRLANKELEQIEKQIIGAEIRVAIAEKDLQMHLLHAEQTREADSVMRSKFTNQELYDWMVTQLSALYFQSYQMAYDMAKRAERAYQFERGIATSAFITFGHWDSLHNGLLAGERLHMDLKRLEVDYINQNKRDCELTRHISLALHKPFALHLLRTTGTCTFDLPESLFDHDHPGHYMRRIKSVALTLPAVVGPYTSVNCRLTLQSSSVRVDPSTPRHYRAEPDKFSDARFRSDLGSVQSIATSRAHSDTGMFEVNFRDERYLPFEGSGVISTWQIDLDPRCNDFDLSTLSDVVMELRYTARDGGDALRTRCLTEMTAATSHEPQARLFSARTDFADAWNEFLYPISNTPGQTLTLDIDSNRFGFRAQQATIAISEIHVVLMLSKEGVLAYPSGGLKVVITDPNLRTITPGPTVTPPSPAGLALPAGATPSTRDVAGGLVRLTPAGVVGQWKITLPNDVLTLPESARLLAPVVSGSPARLAPEMVEDLLVFVVY